MIGAIMERMALNEARKLIAELESIAAELAAGRPALARVRLEGAIANAKQKLAQAERMVK